MHRNINKVIFSGIQPTGVVHLGNYLGAIRNWVKMQNSSKENELNIFSLVDMHALSDKYKLDHDINFETSLKHDTLTLAASIIASGIDPNKSILFVQSQVPEHAELTWILSCIAPMNWLNKMTQFKEKKHKGASLALFSYPVLMAADILLYRANEIPVGEDQIQHIELARDYAVRFNSLFCKQGEGFFPLPKAVNTTFPRVMSLKDGTKKMSKSDFQDASRINILDDPELIIDKILKAKTDSISKVKFDDHRPEVNNLLKIYSTLENKSFKETEAIFENSSLLQFKEELAKSVIKNICPIGEKTEELLQDTQSLAKILREGSEKAREIANANLKEIKKLTGMLG